ncbi:MAG: hypothetical protein ACRD6W_19095 [Nitrososphaerales archaeon]
MLCAGDAGDPAGPPHPSQMAAVQVDGVVVLFDNPDERYLQVATIGGTPEDNARVMELWYDYCEEEDPDGDSNEHPEKACDAFVAWLAKQA